MVLDSWKAVRQETAQGVEDFPAADLDFKPVDTVMSFRELARHILDAGHAITGPQFRESLQKYIAELPATPDAASLAHALRQNLELRAAQLAAKPPSSSST
jgi:hypothetical protein